jgi:hypothetical protein
VGVLVSDLKISLKESAACKLRAFGTHGSEQKMWHGLLVGFFIKIDTSSPKA